MPGGLQWTTGALRGNLTRLPNHLRFSEDTCIGGGLNPCSGLSGGRMQSQMDLLPLLKAALLGIVEGVTEFIPVSSTGHLILAQDWFGFTGRKENAFIIFIQLGAILAVVWLYRMKFIDVLLNLHRKSPARSLVFNLVIGTLPAVVIGLPTEKWIEAHLFRPIPVALAFIVGGLAFLW